jgi:uncharacterized membrane protein YkoI
MPDRFKKALLCVGAVSAVAVGGAQLAGAKTSKSKRAHATQTAQGRGGSNETVLTGATADSVKAAVLAKLPGATIERMSNESDGKSTDAYEVHATKSDGTRVEVLLDSSFGVTAVNTDNHHGGPGGRGDHGGPGDHGGRGGSGETALTGTTLDQVKAAVASYLPGSTLDRASTENDGKSGDAYEAHVTKADGSHVTVFLDSSFNVTGTK